MRKFFAALLCQFSGLAGRLAFALAVVLATATPALASPAAEPSQSASFAPATTWFFAEGSTQPPFDTWFLIQNPGPVTANVTLTFQIQGGGTVTRPFVVGPTSRFSVFANQVIPNVAFSTRVDSSQPIFAERSMFVNFDGTDVTGIASPQTTWLFGEGSTQNPFQTWLLIQNPNSTTATATITYFLLGGGTPATQVLSLPPTSRTSVFVNQILPNQAFSVQVNSSQPTVVEESIFRFPGNAAAATAGANAPSNTWYFADAKTGNHTIIGVSRPFDSFLLLQNPNPTPVTATITLYESNGSVVTVTQGLPPNSRQTLFLNQVLPSARMGIRVSATGNIVVERSMFFGTEPRGAMGKLGSSGLATQWFLAEGSTQQPFHEIIYILNPNPTSMTAHLDFLLPSGQVVGRDVTVPARTPLSVDVNSLVVNSPVSARITTSQPSVVERQMFFVKNGSLGGTDAIAIR